MAELLIVSMIDDFTPGKRFQHWDRHITIVPWFESEADPVVEMVTSTARLENPIHGLASGEAMFGPGANIPVKLVESEELRALHHKLIYKLGEIGITIDGRYTGERYRPHISLKRGALFEGKDITLHSIQLAENIGQGYRRIIADAPFTGGLA